MGIGGKWAGAEETNIGLWDQNGVGEKEMRMGSRGW